MSVPTASSTRSMDALRIWARNTTEPAGGESSAHAVARTDNARLRVTDRSMGPSSHQFTRFGNPRSLPPDPGNSRAAVSSREAVFLVAAKAPEGCVCLSFLSSIHGVAIASVRGGLLDIGHRRGLAAVSTESDRAASTASRAAAAVLSADASANLDDLSAALAASAVAIAAVAATSAAAAAASAANLPLRAITAVCSESPPLLEVPQRWFPPGSRRSWSALRRARASRGFHSN